MSKLSISRLAGITQTLGQVTVPAGHILDVEGSLLNSDHTGAFQLPRGTTAQRPSTALAGYTRFNTTDNKIEIYTGTQWKQFDAGGGLGGGAGSVSQIGKTEANAASSAAAILAANPNAPDGPYWLNHGTGAYRTWCMMDAGGYHLVAKINNTPADTSNPWSFSGARWNQQNTTNEGSSVDLQNGDVLNRGYYGYTLTTGFLFGMENAYNWLHADGNRNIARSGLTARQAFNTRHDMSQPDREDFLQWMMSVGVHRNNWDNQPYCNRVGFFRQDSSNTGMRFGITMNNENECNSNDSSIGFGIYTNNQNTSGDRNAAAGGFRWNGTTRYPRSGFIFVK